MHNNYKRVEEYFKSFKMKCMSAAQETRRHAIFLHLKPGIL